MNDALSPQQGHLFVAFGTMRDKDLRAMSALLAEFDAHVYLLPVQAERAATPAELALIFDRFGIAYEIVQGARDVLEFFYENAQPEDGLLITGSHLVAAQFPELAVAL
jgi:folylpolyglutamate synthase/dihydropteroate synthase